MLFKVQGKSIAKIVSSWTPKEEDVEKLIKPATAGEFFNDELFQESILYLGRQLSFANKKRLDMLGIDSRGRTVIFELKRDNCALGAETQALNYLAQVAGLSGSQFLDFIGKLDHGEQIVAAIRDFVEVPEQEINGSSRLILIARSFDRALYSLGNWIAGKGVPFKCFLYEPVEVGNLQLLNFSVGFNSSSSDEYASDLFQRAMPRAPGVFWHNIGNASSAWWDRLRNGGWITANYTNKEESDCMGWQKLHQYIAGDEIIAYASGYGAVGAGRVVSNPATGYKYFDHKSPANPGSHFHHLKVEWGSHVPLARAVANQEIHTVFGLNHPSGTKQRIQSNPAGARALIDKLKSIS